MTCIKSRTLLIAELELEPTPATPGPLCLGVLGIQMGTFIFMDTFIKCSSLASILSGIWEPHNWLCLRGFRI